MDQYLQWDSHNNFSAKYSVINTFIHKTNPEFLKKKKEKECLRKALTNYKYPKWSLDKVEKRLTRSSSEVSDGANSQGTAVAQSVINKVKTKCHIVIQYTQGLCKNIKKICGRYVIQTHFKDNSTMKNLPVFPKDKDAMVNKSGAICHSMCPGPSFPLLYIEGQLEHSLWCAAQSDCLCSDDQAHMQTFPPKVSKTSSEHRLVMSWWCRAFWMMTFTSQDISGFGRYKRKNARMKWFPFLSFQFLI